MKEKFISKDRCILILDTSYTLKMFKERHLERALESRKLGGYFSLVISVHPLVGLFETGDSRYGKPVINHLDESHIFIEGKIGVSRLFNWFPHINFIFSQLQLIIFLIKYSRLYKVQAIRVGDPYYLGILGFILSRILSLPLVARIGFRFDELVRVTGKPVMARIFKYRWIEKIIEKFVFSKCDLIAGANEDNMLYAIENGGRKSVATIFRYGNLLHASHWQEPDNRMCADNLLAEFGILGERFAITVARLEPMKYVEDAVRALAEFHRRGYMIKWLLVGDGLLRKNLQDLASSLGIGNEVIFAGNRTQDWLASVLPRATVVISPHMGRALAEAALASLPIIAFDYDWQREIVIDGHTGYLVPHQDWLGLSDKLESVFLEPKRAREMGENARKLVLDMMDPEKLEIHEQNQYTKLFEKFSDYKRVN
jgi:glycosyltransferase involved in cell wall biosynthesis